MTCENSRTEACATTPAKGPCWLLSNQYGWHWVLNNQSDGAHAHLCTGSGGAGCNYDMAAQNGVWADLTPVNSITLDRP
ncbi:hypothetical protein [Streptomyces sp. YGL11-2]|uniref:hypothetical protein n=1 Tax=Streptomyces sp. YGL11-2 TaxID=3414028 RepID=UPI003CFA4EAA